MVKSLYPNIDAERARKRLTTEEMARFLGVTRKTFYNWVYKGNIPQKKLKLMSDYFGVSTDYLLEQAN